MSAGNEPTTPSLPPAPALTETPQSEAASYQPLSLLALTSFVLAVVLALFLVGGTAIALWTRTPLLLPPYLLLLAAGIIVLAWLARSQIQNAEGTRGGLWAATWAMRLCLLLAPLYAAYYGATYFAVTAKAQDTSRKWLQLLAEGDVEAAYWWTIAAGQRPPTGQRSRDLLEIQHNASDAMAGGAFSNFRRSDLVRLLSNGGKDATIDQISLNNWGYEMGGYQVQGTYRISNSQCTFQVVVTTQGITPNSGEVRERQWHIVQGATHRQQDVAVTFTPQGGAYQTAAMSAQVVLGNILLALGDRQFEKAFELTLPEADRESIKTTQRTVLALGLGTGSFPRRDAVSLRVLEARANWFAGGIFDTDPKRFWTITKDREEILETMRGSLSRGLASPSNPNGPRWNLAQRVVPKFTVAEDGTSLIGLDLQCVLPRAGVRDTPFAVEAIAQFRCKPGSAGALTIDGLERIDLIMGRTMPAGGPGGPGGPGGR